MITIFDLFKEDAPLSHSGLRFRAFESKFFNGEKLEFRHGLRLLKRKSCQCNSCCAILDELREHTDVIMPSLIPGAIYSIRVVNQVRDWETGYVDSWDLEAYLIENEK